MQCRLRPGEYLTSPDPVAAVYYNAHARYSVGCIEHIGVVPWRSEPHLCHVSGITGQIALKDILCASVHPGDACRDGGEPRTEEAIVAERTSRCHVSSMIPAEPVDVSVSG